MAYLYLNESLSLLISRLFVGDRVGSTITYMASETIICEMVKQYLFKNINSLKIYIIWQTSAYINLTVYRHWFLFINRFSLTVSDKDFTTQNLHLSKYLYLRFMDPTRNCLWKSRFLPELFRNAFLTTPLCALIFTFVWVFVYQKTLLNKDIVKLKTHFIY